MVLCKWYLSTQVQVRTRASAKLIYLIMEYREAFTLHRGERGELYHGQVVSERLLPKPSITRQA